MPESSQVHRCNGRIYDRNEDGDLEIDRADELGSGMRKLMLYGKKCGGADPELIEGDIFRMVIGVPAFGANPAEIPHIVLATEQVTQQVTRPAP